MNMKRAAAGVLIITAVSALVACVPPGSMPTPTGSTSSPPMAATSPPPTSTPTPSSPVEDNLRGCPPGFPEFVASQDAANQANRPPDSVQTSSLRVISPSDVSIPELAMFVDSACVQELVITGGTRDDGSPTPPYRGLWIFVADDSAGAIADSLLASGFSLSQDSTSHFARSDGTGYLGIGVTAVASGSDVDIQNGFGGFFTPYTSAFTIIQTSQE